MPSAVLKESNGKSYMSILKKWKTITKSPEDFLSIQEHKSKSIRNLLKNAYDLAWLKDTKNINNIEILPELVLNGLDEEQIWQLIEIRNNVVWPQFLENTSKLLSLQQEKFHVNYAHTEENEDGDNSEVLDDDDNPPSGEDESDDYGSQNEELASEKDFRTKNRKQRKGKPSIVDDKFFKLSEMEEFLKVEDEKEFSKQKGKNVEDDFAINYFENESGSDDEQNIEYKDFFDDEESMRSGGTEEVKMNNAERQFSVEETEREDETDDEKHSDEDNKFYGNGIKPAIESDSDYGTNSKGRSDKPKSSFEERQERLNQRIKEYEQEILGEKPWPLKGEIQATSRPQNSLLEEVLEFEATSRPAPVITEETTLRLEDIIRQRIKDQAWDDVELRVKPLTTPQEYRKKLVLDQEKSKESLAQIYEKQYQNEIEKLNTNASDAKEEEPALHKEIKEMMRSLFVKLDALSNFHFTPKPVAPEPKIVTNTPAVNLEEVAPVAVSNAQLLAPEEIRKRTKGDILGSNERSKSDKNRERRHKKQKQRAIHKALEARDIKKQKLGIKISSKEEQAKMTKKLIHNRNVKKVTPCNDDGSLKTSKAFFAKLQEISTVNNKTATKQKKTNANGLSAKKLKL